MRLISIARRWALSAASILLLIQASGNAAHAASSEEQASAVIAAFDDTLMSIMRNATKLGYEGRYQAFAPAIDRTFDIPFMTRIVVGSAWESWPADRRDQVIQAFRRFIIATYARRFEDYSGEQFILEGTQSAASGLLVDTKIMRPTDKSIALNYRMRLSDSGQYKVVDVFLTGTISELATRRSEFGEVLKRAGADGLVAALAEKSEAPPIP